MAWQASFVLLAGIWGCSFWWIKLGLRFLTPVEVAFGRLVLGATALAVISVVTGSRLPRRGIVWWHLGVVALLLNSLPFTLFAFGETRTSSIMAGILNALTPLATLAVTIVAFPAERPTPERVLGLAVGFGGVLVVLGAWRGFAAGQWAGVAACLGAGCCYGAAFPYTRRHLSGIAYVLNFQVIPTAGSATASAVTYLTPVVAVVVGIAFLGDHVAWHQTVGAIVVLAGVALSQGLASRRGGRLGGYPPVRRPARRVSTGAQFRAESLSPSTRKCAPVRRAGDDASWQGGSGGGRGPDPV